MTNVSYSASNYQVSNKGLGLDENSKQTVSDNFSNNFLTDMVGDEFSPEMLLKTALLIPPLLITDKFINSKLGGEEDKSWLKKITNFGDNIAKKLHLENFKGEKFDNFIKNNRITKYFTYDYSAVPRFSLAKFDPIEIKYSKELSKTLSDLKNNPEFMNLSRETQEFLSGINPEKPDKNIQKLLDETDKLIKEGKINPDKVDKISELRNKLKAASLKLGETKIGSHLAKDFLTVKKSFTFGGGIPGFAFASLALNQSYKAASEAPDGEKLSTFMHLFSEHFIGFLLFEPGINLLYKIGGNKYRGMTIDNRKALEDLVSKTNADETLTKDGLKLAEIKRNLLLKGYDKSEVLNINSLKTAEETLKNSKNKLDLKFWERPLKFFGRFISMGLDKMQIPNFVNLPVIGKTNLSHPTFKGTIGGLLRFASIMFVIQPILQKPITAATHKIFGRPETYLAKEDGNINNEPDDENQEQPAPQPAKPVKRNTETNLLKKLTNNTNIKKQDNNQYKPIASSSLNDRQKSENELYVPSIEVDNSYLIEQEDELNQQIESLLQSSDEKIDSLSQSMQF